MKQKNFFLAGLICVIIFGAGKIDHLQSFTDQTNTEKMIKENKHFIEFINITVTNFGDDKKEQFANAYGKHFNGEVAYLQSDYVRAYKRIYSSQGVMVKLYQDMLKNKYLEDSKDILDKLAPNIIRSKNTKAKHYLTLGYRDRTLGWNQYTEGDATNPKQFHLKLFKFEEAIKMARRAKRYGFLALHESQSLEVKRKIFNLLLKKEKEGGNPFYNRFLDLKDDQMIDEINKNFTETDKTTKDGSKDTGKEISKDTGKETVKGSVKDGEKLSMAEDETYENFIQRTVRYKKERMLARNMMNLELDKAEYEIKLYVKDYNYKLMTSTFEVLSSEEKKEKSDIPFDFNSLKVHLLDNYLRMSKESALNGIVSKVKVEDDLENKEKSKKDTESVEEKKGDTKEKGTAVDTDKKDKNKGVESESDKKSEKKGDDKK